MAIERLGLIKSSLLDYPERVSAVLFTSGCNFHCNFCHNPDLATGIIPASFVTRDEAIEHITRRRAVLDGVVISGGEPLIHDDLPDLVDEIRKFDLQIKIDTNGSHPERLQTILPDYVAIDIKCAPERYRVLTHIADPVKRLARTIEIVKTYDIDFELRTTVVPGLVDADGFSSMLELVKGARRYVLNEYRSERTLDPRIKNSIPYPMSVYESLRDMAVDAGIPCTIRGPSFVDSLPG